MIKTRIFDSLSLILPEKCPENEMKKFSICKNEPFSFQMAYTVEKSTGETPEPEEQHFFIRLTTELDVKLYHVANVPVAHSFRKIQPSNPIGMYPDILIPKKTNPELRR